MEIERTIEITLEEYTDLVETKVKLKMIEDALVAQAYGVEDYIRAFLGIKKGEKK